MDVFGVELLVKDGAVLATEGGHRARGRGEHPEVPCGVVITVAVLFVHTLAQLLVEQHAVLALAPLDTRDVIFYTLVVLVRTRARADCATCPKDDNHVRQQLWAS